MPAFWTPAFRECRESRGVQRSEDEEALTSAKLTFHDEAGTWRGSDIAAAATIVASNTLRVHMVAS